MPDRSPHKLSLLFYVAILIGSILLCQAAGALGALGMKGQETWNWYNSLAKPPVTPPGWVFGPVWVTLYIIMGVAFWLVVIYGRGKRGFRPAVVFFVAQLIINAIWSPVFFGMQSIGLALVVIILLLIAIGATIYTFTGVYRTAAWLMVPYALWVAFATVLNFWLWLLNR